MSKKSDSSNFLKGLDLKQKITVICLLIVITGMFGWFYEFIFYFFNSGMKTFYMRGGNFLPFINIYVYGSFIILFLAYRFRKKPILVFLISMISTGILEYLSGYILYGKLGWTKCWDYNQEILNFGNIDGYVCLRSVLVFGMCGLLLVYVVVPLLLKLVKTKHINLLLAISVIVCGIFLVDEVYNLVFVRIFGLPGVAKFYKSLGFKYIYFK